MKLPVRRQALVAIEVAPMVNENARIADRDE